VLAADAGTPRTPDYPAMVSLAKRIMVGFDGSASARRALDRAADLAGYGSSVTVVTVSAPTTNGDGGKLLHEAKEQLAARLIPSYALNPVGDPAEELLKAASSLGADVIVIGTQPNGSVGARLLAQAPCDVLVVR
jgi:nucleotide-binding universal stress UspA family protein